MAARASLTDFSEEERVKAMARYEVLEPHLLHGVTLADAARAAGVGYRTAQRWLAWYSEAGLVGLVDRRSDRGAKQFPDELVELIEGLALKRPKPLMTWIHRQAAEIARRESWPEPSYSSVKSIISRMDPALLTLAQQGPRAYSEGFELIHRHEAEGPNDLWQADHTRLDLILVDETRPWLTVIADDYSRAVAGYSISLDDPSAINTSLALRQAILPKPDPAWAIYGIPNTLYVDHGSDFISEHLEQVAAELNIRLIHSAVGQPGVPLRNVSPAANERSDSASSPAVGVVAVGHVLDVLA